MPVARTAWWIDWGDDGFQSPYVDMTPVRISARCRFGGHVGPKSFGVSPANGQLLIWNKDALYDPDVAGPLSETALRLPHRVRFLADDLVRWEGRAQFLGRTEGLVPTLGWQLYGLESLNATEGIVSINRRGGTVADVVADINEGSSLEIGGGTSQSVGVIEWEGSPLYAMEATQRFAGGFMLELPLGQWQFIRWTDTPQMPISADFDQSTYFLQQGFSFAERPDWVRNYCVAEGQAVVSDPAASDLRKSRRMGPQQQAVLVLASPDASAPVDEGLYLTDSATASVVSVTTRLIGGQRVAYVRVQTTADHPAGEFVSVTAPAVDAVSVTPFDPVPLEIEEFGTQEVFRRRALKLPPWFPAGAVGLYEWTRPYLRNLSQPALMLDATYHLNSETEAANASLTANAVPGRRNTFETQTGIFDGLVLSTTVTDVMDSVASWRVQAIAAIDRPAAPLGVVLSASDVQVEATVSTEHPDGRDIFGRYRTA